MAISEYAYTQDSITHVESGRSLHYEQTVSVPSGGHVRGQYGWDVVGIPGGKYGEVLLQKGSSQWKVPMLNCQPTSPAPGSQDALDAAKEQHPASSTSPETEAPTASTRGQAEEVARAMAREVAAVEGAERGAILRAFAEELALANGDTWAKIHVWARRADGKMTLSFPSEITVPQPVTYPAGTRVGTIKDFDRSQHLTFRCTDHPEAQYLSKDPFVSAWAPVGLERAICPPSCELPLNDYEIVLDYVVTPRQ